MWKHVFNVLIYPSMTAQLIDAVKSNSLDKIIQLVDVHQCDITVPDIYNKTAIDYAIELQYNDIISYLRSRLRIQHRNIQQRNNHNINDVSSITNKYTLNELLHRLIVCDSVAHDNNDTNELIRLRNTLLMTLPYYTTPLLLVQQLIIQYKLLPTPTQSSIQWKQCKLRCFTLLQYWMKSYTNDFVDDEVYEIVHKFLSSYPLPSFNALHHGIYLDCTGLLHLAQSTLHTLESIKHQSIIDIKTNKHKHQKNMSQQKFTPTHLNIHKRQLLQLPDLMNKYNINTIAPQFILLSSQRLLHIHARDLCKLNRAIHNQIYISNQHTCYVATDILTKVSPSDRINTFVKYIKIAGMCLSMNDYCTVFEISYGLQHQSIYRLKLYDSLTSTLKQQYDTIVQFTSSDHNYTAYRTALHELTTNQPQLPQSYTLYYGIIYKDLIAVEECNTIVDPTNNQLINIDTLQLLYNIMDTVVQSQTKQIYYTNKYTVDPQLRDDIILLQSCYLSVDELEQLSCQIIPRSDHRLPPTAKQYLPITNMLTKINRVSMELKLPDMTVG